MPAAFAIPTALPLRERAIPLRTSLSSRRPTRTPLSRRRAPPAMVQPGTPSTMPAHLPAALTAFKSFFEAMPGAWNSQRTYHYLTPGTPQAREESQTTFDVDRLTPAQVEAVLASNSSVTSDPAAAEGFRVSFLTRMASQGELVRAGTNLAFVPDGGPPGLVTGDYYRDLGYEEAAPIKARFVFDAERMELQMTTFYTKVVSVDEIRLVNEGLRLRRIVNYRRPQRDGEPLTNVMLVGFGVECKGEEQRLVE